MEYVVLDIQEDPETDLLDALTSGPLDAKRLVHAIQAFSASELAELEDDLDFAAFTGVKSAKILDIMAKAARRAEVAAA